MPKGAGSVHGSTPPAQLPLGVDVTSHFADQEMSLSHSAYRAESGFKLRAAEQQNRLSSLLYSLTYQPVAESLLAWITRPQKRVSFLLFV